MKKGRLRCSGLVVDGLSASSAGAHAVGIGTAQAQTCRLPGFIGPNPSTALDECTYEVLIRVYDNTEGAGCQGFENM